MTVPDPTFTHGSKAQFFIGTLADPETLVEISDRLNTSSLPWQRDKAEVSTYGSTTKRYVGGLKDASIPLEGPYDPWVDGIFSDLLGIDDVKFRYRPVGSGTGKPEFNGRLFVDKHEVATPVSGAATFSANGQLVGDAPRTLQA